MKRLLMAMLILGVTSEIANSADPISLIDERCAMEKVAACIDNSLPIEYIVVKEAGAASLVIQSPKYGKVTFFKDREHIVFSRYLDRCPSGYIQSLYTSNAFQCTKNSSVFIMDNGDIVGTKFAIPPEAMEICSFAVRQLGSFGGKSCAKVITFPHGANMEVGLISAFNKIGDNIKGVGERVKELADKVSGDK